MIRLTQTTSLQQKMAPQLIHSLRLLQMPTLELGQIIQQELETNPLLEIAEEVDQDEEEPEEEEPEEEDELELDELEFDDADLDDVQFDGEDWND